MNENCKHKEQQNVVKTYCHRHNQYLTQGSCDFCPEYEEKQDGRGK
jgi:hypothetical protein